MRATGSPTISTPTAPPRRSALPWLAVAFAGAGFVASLGYLMSATPQEPPAIVAAQPPPEPAPAPPDASSPADAAVAELPPAEQPEPAPAMGTLELDVKPFAEVKLNGRPWQAEVVGIKRFSLKVGRYTLELVHPRGTVKKTNSVTPNHVTRVQFDAFEKR